MAMELTDERFGEIADRWYPLIYRGAFEYSVPGKLDTEDLVQEGLMLLHSEIKKRVVELQMWEVASQDFEKYFKSALFHRFVDLKRTLAASKRDYKKEVRATDEYDPIANLVLPIDDQEQIALSRDQYQRLLDRLSPLQQDVLECLVHPPDELLKSVRHHSCPECLWVGDPSQAVLAPRPDGGTDAQCPECHRIKARNPDITIFQIGILEPVKSPARVVQSEIQTYLGLKRMALTNALWAIRETYRTLDETPDIICLRIFLTSFGYDTLSVASCRLSDGTPSFRPISYHDLRSILVGDEVLYLDFMVSHSSRESGDYYSRIKFTDLSRRLHLSVHRLREAVDSIRIKLEYVDSGVPLPDVPRDLTRATGPLLS